MLDLQAMRRKRLEVSQQPICQKQQDIAMSQIDLIIIGGGPGGYVAAIRARSWA